MSDRNSTNIAATILTSVITSAIITVGILYFTGNLGLAGGKPATVSEKSSGLSQDENTVEAPSLKGLTTDIASDVLKSRGLRLVVIEERANNEFPKGQICEQDPLPASMLNAGGAVAVYISTGPDMVEVPDVAGKSLEEAKKMLSKAGFEIGEIKETDTGTPGTVAGTIPEKGSIEDRNATVDIAVTGSPTVPKLIGMRLSKGKTALTDAGLKVGRIKWGYSDYHNIGVIYKQDPKEGTVVAPGTEVTVTVNSDD